MHNLLLILFSFLISTFAMANDEYKIQLKSGEFTPEVTTNFEMDIQANSIEENQGSIYRIIQFYEIPSRFEKQAIASAGIKLLGYIPNKAFFCKIDQNASIKEFSKLNIRSIFVMNSNLKIAKALTKNELPEWALNGNNIKLNVRYFSKEDRSKVVKFIESTNGVVLENLETINTIIVQYTASEINRLAENPLIQWIEPIAAPPTPDDTKGKASSRSTAINTNFTGGRKYDGTGMVVALSDGGFVGPHIDFTGRLTNHELSSVGTHQNMTTGIFVGAGNLDPTAEGMAPGAEMNTYRTIPVLTLGIQSYPHVYNAVDYYDTLGTVITSTSFSQGEGGIYTVDCEFVDQQVDENKQLVHVFSAGNAGNSDHDYGAGAGWGNISGGTKAAKNIICVGNLTQSESIYSSSSRGPAADGRIKPDISAKGEGHTTTDANNTYQSGSGTSAAAPLVAGVVTQIYQAYKELNGGNEPESALIKAAILNTANDIENTGPDFKSGWGSINALKAVRIIEDERYVRDSIEQGENVSHMFTIPDDVAQVKIMTYWSDVEASPTAAKALVNDINMQVIDPEGINYNPWVLDPTPNPTNLNALAVQGVDDLNNVEQVTIDNPAAGDYSVNIEGFTIPQGPQVYYIIYEYIYEGVELVYPLGGESLVPSTTETIYWDASKGSEKFGLAYSTDGGVSYSPISNIISSTSRRYNWNVPAITSGELKIRISRGASQSESIANNTVAHVPDNFAIASICPDSIELTWTEVLDASSYEVSMLGNKYMDSIGVTTETNFKIYGLGLSQGNWFSVRAIVDGNKGRRANAIYQEPKAVNCDLNHDIEIAQLIYPGGGVISNCNDLSNTNMIIQINNNGLLEASNIELNYQINGGAIVSEILPSSMPHGEQTQFTFSQQPDLSTAGVYDIKIWNTTTHDENYYNDTITNSINVENGVLISDFPNIETFQSFSNCSIEPDCEVNGCQLAGGWINFENYVYDEIDWRIDNGGTASSDTGPPSDYDLGTTSGKYLYLEATNNCYLHEAVMLSPCIDLSNGVCTAELTFAYHMFGEDIGELHVDLLTVEGIVKDVIPPFVGPQGNQWKLATIDLSPYSGKIINARFRGITGEGAYSDISIDAISIEALSISTADFSFTDDGNEIVFTNNSSGDIDSYLWDFGDGNTSTDANPTHQYSTTDLFDVTLVTNGPCGQDTSTQTIGLSNVNNIDYSAAITINPNPNNGEFTISLPDQLSRHKLNFKLVDIVGKTVINLDNKNQQNSFSVDASAIPNGLYFIKISGENFNVTKRIVKQ